MKRSILISVLFLIGVALFSQSPDAFKYQAVVRDANGNSICNDNVSFKFIVHQGSPTGTEVYEETHDVTTNDFGLANLEIGNGTTSGNFSNIDWPNDTYYITVYLYDEGVANYVEIGTEQVFSVPYAKHSATTNDAVNSGNLDGQPPDYYLNWNNLDNIPSDIADGDDVDDADNDASNEIQTLSQSGNNVTLSYGGGTVSVADNDNNSSNECQQLSLSGNSLTLTGTCTNSTVTLPGVSLWSEDGDDIYYSNGNVSIGSTPNANAKLEIESNGGDDGLRIENNSSNMAIRVINSTNAHNALSITNNASDANSIDINHNGTGKGIDIDHNGSNGRAMDIRINSTTNDDELIWAQTDGLGIGAWFEIDNSSNDNPALIAITNGTGYAGEFDGDVRIYGDLIGGKSSNSQINMTIDHPVDQENKILNHSSLCSPEMTTVYKGRATLQNGETIIQLPDYFDALNHPENREINLTCINGWSPLFLEGKIANNQFVVKTTEIGNPNQEFSWIVYAVRNDKYAQNNPLVVEEEKGVRNRFVKGEMIYNSK